MIETNLACNFEKMPPKTKRSSGIVAVLWTDVRNFYYENEYFADQNPHPCPSPVPGEGSIDEA
jgi:hypothetical protein